MLKREYSFIGLFLIFTFVAHAEDAKDLPFSLQILTKAQKAEIEDLGKKSIDDQITEIKKKVKLELLTSKRPPGKAYFDSIGPAVKSVEQITDIEGLFGKAVCPKDGEKWKIYIAEDAPPATLLHEYIHFLQMQTEKQWCEQEGKILEGLEKKERALLYHRLEFEVLKLLWDNRNQFHLNFEDQIILVEGLHREDETFKAVGFQVLEQNTREAIQTELDSVQSQIASLMWLKQSFEDLGSVLQKMEILNLKACVDQTHEPDETKIINDCISKRCEISDMHCARVEKSELKKFGDDLYQKIIYSWTKPNLIPGCDASKLKDELASHLEESTSCWKQWFSAHRHKREVELKKVDSRKFVNRFGAPDLRIDSKIQFYESTRPEAFINSAYCYLIFQKVTKFSNLPINQFAYAGQAASFSSSRAPDYRTWLEKSSDGKTCSKLVTHFTENPPGDLKKLAGSKKYVLIINPIGALSSGLSSFRATITTNLNHERLHIIFADEPKIREKIKAEWGDLTPGAQAEFKSAHTSYNFDSEGTLLREYFSYSRQDHPRKLFK